MPGGIGCSCQASVARAERICRPWGPSANATYANPTRGTSRRKPCGTRPRGPCVCRSRGLPRTSRRGVPRVEADARGRCPRRTNATHSATRSPWRSAYLIGPGCGRESRRDRTSSSRARRRPIAFYPSAVCETLARRRATCSTPRPISPARALHGHARVDARVARARLEHVPGRDSARGHPMSNQRSSERYPCSQQKPMGSFPRIRRYLSVSASGATIRRAAIRESSRRSCEPPSSKTTRPSLARLVHRNGGPRAAERSELSRVGQGPRAARQLRTAGSSRTPLMRLDDVDLRLASNAQRRPSSPRGRRHARPRTTRRVIEPRRRRRSTRCSVRKRMKASAEARAPVKAAEAQRGPRQNASGYALARADAGRRDRRDAAEPGSGRGGGRPSCGFHSTDPREASFNSRRRCDRRWGSPAAGRCLCRAGVGRSDAPSRAVERGGIR